MAYSSPYQIGGSLQLDSSTYVVRQADRDLYDGLSNGEFCYVLNSRQMGKSSLRVRAMARLQAQGVACVAVQMTDIIDEETTAEQFYAGVIDSITLDLGLDFDNMSWWEANGQLSLVKRFSKFIETVLLQAVRSPLVIFVDEIDRVLSLPFKVNGFFAAIRECYNKRADNPDYRRLTFSLLGVAAPSDLIEDKRSTPFNVGRAVELTGFSLTEAQPLARGLAHEQSMEMLAAILNWTGGQPFLTQKVCRLVEQVNESTDHDLSLLPPADLVDAVVQQNIVENWQANDEPEHLRTIRDRLIQNEHKAARRLGLYQQVLLQGGLSTASATVDANQNYRELKLSGAVVERQGRLQVYNPIYAAIFNPDWAAHELANLRPYASKISLWLRSDRQDESALLQGQALDEARDWAADKVLPPADYAFLAASQELVTEEVEEARQTLALANQTLEEANAEAAARISSANRRLRIGSAVLLGTVALFALTGVYASDRIGNAVEQREAAEEERALAVTETEKAQAARDVLSEETKLAKEEVKETRAEGDRVKQELETQIGEAQQKVEQASEQAQAAQLKRQQAEESQILAQQKAETAEAISNEALFAASEAQANADTAQRDVAQARAEQATIQDSIRLERRSRALLRRPVEQRTGLNYLLDALTIAQALDQLLAPSDSGRTLNFTDSYPTLSLALRTAVNSVLQTAEIKGTRPVVSNNNQRIATSNSINRESYVYDFTGSRLALLDGGSPIFVGSQNNQLITSSSNLPTDRAFSLHDTTSNISNPFPGRFPRFSADRNYMAYASSDSNTSYIVELSTDRTVSIEGIVPSFLGEGNYVSTRFIEENRLHLYDLSGELLHTFDGDVLYPNVNTNNQLIAISDDIGAGNTRLYNLFSGELLISLEGVNAVFSQDGRHIATSQDQGVTATTYLYTSAGQLIESFDGAYPLFNSAGLNGSEQLFVYNRSENVSSLYDFSGEKLSSVEGRISHVSSDGQRLFAGSDSTERASSGQSARWYDFSGQLLASFEKGVPNLIPNDKWLLVSDIDLGISRVYSLFNNNVFARFQAENAGIVSINGAQKLIAYSADDAISRLYELSGQFVAALNGSNFTMVSGDQRIATVSKNSETFLYDLSGRLITALNGRLISDSEDDLPLVTYDPTQRTSYLYDIDGKLLNSIDGAVARRDPGDQRLVSGGLGGRPLQLYDLSGQFLAPLLGQSSRFSDDHRFLITRANVEGTSYLYDLSGQLITSVQGIISEVDANRRELTVSSADYRTVSLYDFDGRFLSAIDDSAPASDSDSTASGDSSRRVIRNTVLRDDSGQYIATIDGIYADFTSDKQRVTTFSNVDGYSRLYDGSGRLIVQLQGNRPKFNEPTGLLVTSAEKENISYVYDFSGQLLFSMKGTLPVFGPDNQKMVTTVEDEGVSRVYDLAGNAIAEFPGSVRNRENWLGFTADSKYFLTKLDDEFYQLWQMDNGLDDLLTRGCEWVRPYLQANPDETRAAFCR